MTTLIWVRGSTGDGPLEPSYMGKAPHDMGVLPLTAMHLLDTPDAVLAFGGGGHTLYRSEQRVSQWLQERMTQAVETAELEAFEALELLLLLPGHVNRLKSLVSSAHVDLEAGSDMICGETPLIIRHAVRIGASKVIDISPRRFARSVAESVSARQHQGHVPAELEWEHVAAQTG